MTEDARRRCAPVLAAGAGRPRVPRLTRLGEVTGSRVLLELDLTEPPVEAPPSDPLGYLQAWRRPTLRGVVDALRDAADGQAGRRAGGPRRRRRAAARPRAGAARGGAGRSAATGKPAVAWAETFGEGGPGTVPYLLATGFGELWLQPSGDLGLTGVAVEATFLRGALDKVGLEPQLGAARTSTRTRSTS